MSLRNGDEYSAGDIGHEMGRAEMVALLDELIQRARQRGITDEIYIVGGAALAMSLDERRMSRDIDAVSSVPDSVGELTRVAREMADEFGLASDWFNFRATPYVPRRNHGAERQIVEGVFCAPPEHLLAMKLVAQRARDVQDIDRLADLLGVRSLEGLSDLFWSVYDRDEAEIAFGVTDPDQELLYAWSAIETRRQAKSQGAKPAG